jgi:peptidoglycan/xylan/chitin deacetylase (PgdA/CDA1 family)
MRAIIVFILLAVISSACTPVVQAESAPAIAQITETPLLMPARTGTPTILPTATSVPTSTPTVIPTLDPIRSTPPTLMLHRPSLQFDSVAFLREFVQILKQNNMKVVTYRNLQENPDLTATEGGRLFIITIDDILLAYPMNQHVIEMIGILQEAGYPAVLGVVTQTDYPDPQVVARLKELSDSGWEIASHTDTHANLGKLEKASEKLVTREVLPSLDKLEKAVGIRPITLILPEGQMVNDIDILGEMDLHWVVGINGGLHYDSRDKIYYVGREGPDKNAQYTYEIMKKRFGF